MKRTALALSLATIVAGLAVAPAGATHPGIHPTFRAERNYFHCTQPTKLQNVNWIVSGSVPWNTTAPAQSVQQGAGCGHVDGLFYGTVPETPYDAVFKGTFTGNIKTISLELHNLLLSKVRTSSTYDIGLRITIDGAPVFAGAQGRRVTMTPTPSSTGASEVVKLSVTDLGCARDVRDAEGNVVDVVTGGLATDDGDGETDHEVIVTVDQWFLDRFAGWVWDTTETPSGITFNGATLETTKVQPDEPATCS